MSTQQITISLQKVCLKQDEMIASVCKFSALYVLAGEVEIFGQTLSEGIAHFFEKTSEAVKCKSDFCEFLIFTVYSSQDETSIPQYGNTILIETFPMELVQDQDFLIRLDRISFPPGARAYRHVHAGSGTRYLVEGELEIKSDHKTTLMRKGNAWFEDANSPVQATAGNDPLTSFVRLLLLPSEYEGKSTITFLDPDDAAKPMLQTNQRFFDQRVTWPI